MAVATPVWGIDIGQSAIKAIRLVPHEDPARVTADAFDYIEYPKILNQQDADPIELVKEALEQFLSRNNLRGCRVAISVEGQKGLARFIKLPPVETKKIPDIVKYEAKQQIPFPLEEVVWDYQQLDGGAVEEGFALETEVGLFAMKRDQVFRALEPLVKADIEVDFIQLAPLALYNFIVFDQMGKLPPPDEFDPENPPESVVILSLGTETTDLVVTNGYRVWQRNIPIGGNHFTKALSKEMKLTFAKAEHLKKNAKQADDPKAIFRAMRPVFNDLLTEVQRSLNFFGTIDRNAKIGKMYGLGNAMKLPALDRFLSQNLGYEVVRLENFKRLSGSSVVEAPAFKDNLLSFATSYGTALQGVATARIHTNLMPREVLRDRMVRAKKPWALAAVAALMLGMASAYFGTWRVWNSVNEQFTENNITWQDAERAATAVVGKSSTYKQDFEKANNEYNTTDATGQLLTDCLKGADQWMQVYAAISQALPRHSGEMSEKISERNQIRVMEVANEQLANVADWYARAQNYPPIAGDTGGQGAAAPAAPGAVGGMTGQPPAGAAAPAATPGAGPTANEPPSGPGWIFRLTCHHFHNEDPSNRGREFVLATVISSLQSEEMQRIGISHPIVIGDTKITPVEIRRADSDKESAEKTPAEKGKRGEVKTDKIDVYPFLVEFCWRPGVDLRPKTTTEATPQVASAPGGTN